MSDPTPTLDAIRQSVRANGWPPTVSELASRTGRAPTAVRLDLAILEDRGAIERGRGARCIRVVETGGAA